MRRASWGRADTYRRACSDSEPLRRRQRGTNTVHRELGRIVGAVNGARADCGFAVPSGAGGRIADHGSRSFRRLSGFALRRWVRR